METLNLSHLYFRKQLLSTEMKAKDPVEVAASICGVNAQRGITIYLSFWNRMHNLHKKEVDKALYQTRRLVKIWCMRGTVHVIPSTECHLYMKATNPSRLWSPHISRDFCDIIMKVLEEPLTKTEIADRIKGKVTVREKELLTTVDRALRMLGYEGLIVFGNQVGTGFTFKEYKFALTENWLPTDVEENQEMREEKARQELLLRYLRCYGPARVQDFAYWAGFRVGEARTVFDSVEVEKVEIRGKSYYVLPGGDREPSEVEGDQVVLLPPYDSYVMGHKDKSRLMEEEFRSQVFLPYAEVAPTVVKNGKVIGIWKTKKTEDMLRVHVNLWEKNEDNLSAVDEELKKITRFMGLTYEIEG